MFVDADSSESFSVHSTYFTHGAKKLQEYLSVYRVYSATGHPPDLTSDSEMAIDY